MSTSLAPLELQVFRRTNKTRIVDRSVLILHFYFLNKKIEPNVATNLVHAIQVTSHYNNLSYYMSNETFL
ncbi:MAG TPA: hypothetical protein OIM45_08355 [Clostridiaceae bacterium]|nr:hypothetical protein [Clostridiaceae bacterium]